MLFLLCIHTFKIYKFRIAILVFLCTYVFKVFSVLLCLFQHYYYYFLGLCQSIMVNLHCLNFIMFLIDESAWHIGLCLNIVIEKCQTPMYHDSKCAIQIREHQLFGTKILTYQIFKTFNNCWSNLLALTMIDFIKFPTIKKTSRRGREDASEFS